MRMRVRVSPNANPNLISVGLPRQAKKNKLPAWTEVPLTKFKFDVNTVLIRVWQTSKRHRIKSCVNIITKHLTGTPSTLPGNDQDVSSTESNPGL